MPDHSSTSGEFIWMNRLLMGMVVSGGLAFLFSVFFWGDQIMPVIPGFFKDSLTVPVTLTSLGGEVFSVEMDNFLVFQQFESLPPSRFPMVTRVFGGITWLLFVVGLSLISTLKRNYLIAALGATMLLFAFSGVNGLNIGAISSNYALIGLLIGTVVPTLLLSFYGGHLGIWKRFLILLVFAVGTLYLLLRLSPISDPVLWMAENASFIASIVGSLFLLHIGHVVVAGTSIFLIRLNKGTAIKISWHILLVSLLYFLLVLYTLLREMGDINLPFPTVPPGILLLIAGLVGFWVVKLKISQSPQAFGHPLIGTAFYWTGFALVLWTWAYAQFVGNEPLYQFLKHIFLYGQIVLSLLFTLYLFANFSDILSSGKDVDSVLFKPNFFAYFHMRIGATMGLVVMVIFAEAVVGVQLSAANTNIAADYYYHVDKPLEAAILYENSWELYRRNGKASNAATHIRFDLRQTSTGMENLTRSFDFAPSVPNTILLSSKLFQQEKLPEAIFYLQKGLEYFPDEAMLANYLGLLLERMGRTEEAVRLLDQASPLPAAQSNLLAMRAKHGASDGGEDGNPTDIPSKVNTLAMANQKGKLSAIDLGTQTLPDNQILANAILRNQWTNHTSTPFEEDLSLIDSLILIPQMSFEELEFRETRVIRTLTGNYINESLKYLNGIAQQFPQSSGCYHGIAANTLISQLDFEKAAVDMEIAFERGYEAFRSPHLAIAYFAGRESLAMAIHKKLNISFPDWMVWEPSGQLIENELVGYFSAIAKLHQQMPEDFLNAFQTIQDPTLKSEFAFFILLHKSHWLSGSEYLNLKTAIASAPSPKWTESELDQWYDFAKNKTENLPESRISKLLKPDIGLDRNAYWTPLVLVLIKQEPDELRRYEILQEAIQFNKDPMLWITFVKQSRKIGMENYGSNALSEMGKWLTNSQIEQLQMENF